MTLVLDQIVFLARKTLGGNPSVFFAPDIPPAKLSRVGAAHRLLPDAEVAVLHDDTLFGSAEDGFLLTPLSLHWKNFGEEPLSVSWEDIGAEAVFADGSNVCVGGGTIRIALGHEFATQVVALLREVADLAKAGMGDDPYRSVSMVEPRSLTHDEVVAIATRVFSGVERFHLAPDIPPAKLENVRRIHASHLPAAQPIALLFDDTLFGGAEEGFVVTSERICWKNLMDGPRSLAFAAIKPTTVAVDGYSLKVAGGTIHMCTAEASVETAATFLRTLLALRLPGAVK